MKKIRMLLCLLALTMFLGVPAVKVQVQAAAENTVKTGLVKKGKKYYFYNSKGKKVTSTWKKIKDKETGKTYKYYFNKQGVAYAGKVVYEQKEYVIKTIKGAKYGFDEFGHMLKGTYLSYDSKNFGYKFYVFNTTGKLNNAKTQKIRKASEYQDKWAALKKLLGKPKKSEELEGGCYGDGTEYMYTYANFTVNTFKPANGGAEIVLGVSPVTK